MRAAGACASILVFSMFGCAAEPDEGSVDDTTVDDSVDDAADTADTIDTIDQVDSVGNGSVDVELGVALAGSPIKVLRGVDRAGVFSTHEARVLKLHHGVKWSGVYI